MTNMSFYSICRTILRILFVITNNLYCIPTYCVWMLIFTPLKRYHPDLYWRIEGTFFHWLLAMVSMWSWSAGYDIVEVGDDIRLCLEDRTLVIANHQSTADVPMLMATFNPKFGVLPQIMWIMDRVFKFTNFGIVSILHKDFFILSGKDCREDAVQKLKKHLQDSYIPLRRKLMVLFPEGGFLRKRREASKRYALKNNLPVLNNVSLPRLGAMQAIIDVMGANKEVAKLNSANNISGGDIAGAELTWILDITIAYPDGKPLDLPTIITGWRKPCQTFLFYRLYPSRQVPTQSEEMSKWLFTRWEEKERILSTFYSTGEIPVNDYCSSSIPAQTIKQDPVRFLLIHMFFITSSYIHFRLFTFLYTLMC
uniref:Phospholipid/glycerol acyltransferase domain-containing protein n=1 Tax=Clastoptera arizonana TaxID=38151 RepID=A0A1B6CCX9_9HEMI